MRYTLIHIICFLSFFCVQSQINISWNGNGFEQIGAQPDSTFESWKSYNNQIKEIQFKAFESGFLGFSIDSLNEVDSTHFNAFYTMGEQWTWKNVQLSTSGPQPPDYLTKKWKNKIITPKQFIKTIDATLLYFQNNGYPFAKAQLDSIQLNQQALSARLNIEPGKKVVWDTIKIEGNVKLRKYYLENYLGIKVGKSYSEETFIEIQAKLKELPFVKTIKKPQINFIEDKAQVVLFLKDKSANFINGVIGVLPNSNSTLTGDNSKLVITGDVKLNLGNSFGFGEKIKINWKRIQTASQELSTSEELPFLLKSPFGLTHSLNLLKQDSTFITFKNRIGIKYDIDAKKSFTVFWENDYTNTLTETSINKSNLTSNSGSRNAYGLSVSWDNLDYRFNPRKGFYVDAEAKAGIKNFAGVSVDDKVRINISDENDVTSFLYVPKSSMLYEGSWSVGVHIPIWKVTTLKIANQTGALFNDYLLDNDLYRLGGFNFLRGFDQQSVFATNYSIFTLEYRFLFEENSNLNIFFDQSLVQQSTLRSFETIYPTTIGAGVNFQTKPGVFSLSYALGKIQGNPFNFSAAKIHFGFVNLF